MRHFRTTCAISALISATFAHAACADITAEQAWSAMRDLLTGSGYVVDAKEAQDGDALVVSDLVMTMTAAPEVGTTKIDFGTLRFTEAGDGTVHVDMPKVIPFTTTITDPDTNTPVTAHVGLTQTGADVVISGTPDNLTQSFTAKSLDIALTSIDMHGAALPPDAVRFSVTVDGLRSTATMGQGKPRPMQMSADARSVGFDMAFDAKAEGVANGKAAAKGQMTNVAFNGTGSLPTVATPGDLYAMLKSGYAVDGTFTYDSGSMNVSGEEKGQSFTADSSSGAGKLDMSLSGDSITYDVSQAETAITATLAELPFPLALKAAVFKAGLTLPISKSEDPKDFKLLVNLKDFVMSDMIWSMFDPQSVLPRDPATLLVDLSGKAKVLVDLLDPDFANKVEDDGEVPGQIEALDINALDLDMVGARLTGKGSFTFDNSNVAAFGGMPKPVGELDLTLAGGNALLDKLGQMGLIGPQEAGSARMMMGLLGVPGDAPDTLKSKLAIDAEGHISANGQRIQ